MLFCNHIDNFKIRRRTYLNDFSIAHGVLGSYSIKGYLSPNTPSAIDKEKHLAFKKMHQEYLERSRIHLNSSQTSSIQTINIHSGELRTISREHLGYGYSSIYGSMDTTGTASGLDYEQCVRKAKLELIEKNEALLFWYKGIGEKVVICNKVRELIDNIGFYSDEVRIYASAQVSNIRSILVILFKNGCVLATGISCEYDEKKALIKALQEAKLLECFNQSKTINPYINLYLNGYKVVYQYLNQLDATLPEIQYEDLINNKVLKSKYEENIEVVMLNTNTKQKWITLRCLSTDLINSIPVKSKIEKVIYKKIFIENGITMEDIEHIPGCIII